MKDHPPKSTPLRPKPGMLDASGRRFTEGWWHPRGCKCLGCLFPTEAKVEPVQYHHPRRVGRRR